MDNARIIIERMSTESKFWSAIGLEHPPESVGKAISAAPLWGACRRCPASCGLLPPPQGSMLCVRINQLQHYCTNRSRLQERGHHAAFCENVLTLTDGATDDSKMTRMLYST